MGKASNGIGGTVNGKVGQQVFYELNGQDIVRSIGHRTSPRTAREIESSNKQTIWVNFFKSVEPFIRKGFGRLAENTIYNFHNLATSYNSKHATAITSGKPSILFDQVVLSQGAVAAPANPKVTISGHDLLFSWAYDEHADWENGMDRTMILAYFPQTKSAVIELSGAKRSLQTDILELIPGMNTQEMHIYLAFCSAHTTAVSNSIYLGQI